MLKRLRKLIKEVGKYKRGGAREVVAENLYYQYPEHTYYQYPTTIPKSPLSTGMKKRVAIWAAEARAKKPIKNNPTYVNIGTSGQPKLTSYEQSQLLEALKKSGKTPPALPHRTHTQKQGHLTTHTYANLGNLGPLTLYEQEQINAELKKRGNVNPPSLPKPRKTSLKDPPLPPLPVGVAPHSSKKQQSSLKKTPSKGKSSKKK